MAYNEKYGITPRTVMKEGGQKSILDVREGGKKAYVERFDAEVELAADPIVDYMNKEQLLKLIHETEQKMKKAAKELDFISAAQYRDELLALKKKVQ